MKNPKPSPEKNEKRQKFISDCMGNLKKEFPKDKQRIAVCLAKWEKAKQTKGSEDINWDDFSDEKYILY